MFADSTQALFTYNAVGSLLRARDPSTDLVFTYDANSRLRQVTDNLVSKTISYEYDGVGNRLRMRDGEGVATTYSYDAASRLQALNRNSQLFGFTYDDGDRVTRVAFPNGASTAYTYTVADQIERVINRNAGSAIISSFAYEYDNVGNRTRLSTNTGDRSNYLYDGGNQLVQEQRSGGAASYIQQFAYDAAGNRVRLSRGGAVTTYTYDAGDELVQETTGANLVAYAYDGNGNQIRKRTDADETVYSYDVRNRLAGVVSPAATARYMYDVLGRRVMKSVSGVTTRYAYDELDAITEYGAGGSVEAKYVYSLGLDSELVKETSVGRFYYMRDGLNSVRDIIDDAQVVRNRYDYDSWGRLLTRVEGTPNDRTYTGRLLDNESGLYDYRTRMYDSSIGRFIQTDRIDDNTGRSLYLYVDNNPVNNIDPLGLWSWGEVFAAVVAVVVVVVIVAVVAPAALPAVVVAAVNRVVVPATLVIVLGPAAPAIPRIVQPLVSALRTATRVLQEKDKITSATEEAVRVVVPRAGKILPLLMAAFAANSANAGSNDDHNGNESGDDLGEGAESDGGNKGDANGDGTVKPDDVRSIFDDRGQPASGADDPRDTQPDGVVTVNDARIAALKAAEN